MHSACCIAKHVCFFASSLQITGHADDVCPTAALLQMRFVEYIQIAATCTVYSAIQGPRHMLVNKTISLQRHSWVFTVAKQVLSCHHRQGVAPLCSAVSFSLTDVVFYVPKSGLPESKSFGGRDFICSSSWSLASRSCSSNVKASDKFTARNVLGSLTLGKEDRHQQTSGQTDRQSTHELQEKDDTYWLNLARSVLMTCSQSMCGVKLRLGAQPMQCRLSSCTCRGSKTWQPGLIVIRML